MSQTEKKTKLSDIARQTNTEKAKRFSSTMIPPPPGPRELQASTVAPTPPVATTPAAEVSREESWKGEEEAADSAESIKPVDDPQPIGHASHPATMEKPAPAKPARSRRSGGVAIDDVVNGEPPKGEHYPRQVRIAESHHKLLRKLAFMHDKTMNHLLYNLLELLNQADQRDQQNHV